MNRTSIAKAALWVGFLLGSPFVNIAAAYQCAELTEYVDMWDDSDQVNASLGLYARGVADAGGEPCGVQVRTYLLDPNNSQVASAYGYGTGYATSQVVIYLDWNSVRGAYTARTEGWSQSIHYGYSQKAADVTAFEADYRYYGPVGGKHLYTRCTTGPCFYMRVVYTNITPPPYLRMGVLKVNYGTGDACFGALKTPIAGC